MRSHTNFPTEAGPGNNSGKAFMHSLHRNLNDKACLHLL